MKKGFTLIELAIVVVVIGIIVGGTLTAQSIIRSAKVRGAIQEIEQMNTAIKAFRLEFDEVPGRMQNAYDYWGSDCGINNDNPSYGCNGDAIDDRCIDSNGYDCSMSSNYSGDVRRAILHLALSGIHPDLPIVPDPSEESNCRKQIPQSSLGTYKVIASNTPDKIWLYFLDSSNDSPFTGSMCRMLPYSATSLSPKTAKEIDDKIDDGNGRRGIVKAIYRYEDNSYSSAACLDSDGVYNISESDKTCGLRAEID